MNEIESKLAVLNATLTSHSQQDQENFERLSIQISDLDDKVDQLLLREARKDGEASGIKKSTAVLSSVISAVISIAAIAAQAYFG